MFFFSVSAVFIHVFFASVLDACLKCFNCLFHYVAGITSRYFKIGSGWLHNIAMVFQLYIANVSSDLHICCKDFDLHVAVLEGATGGCCYHSGA